MPPDHNSTQQPVITPLPALTRSSIIQGIALYVLLWNGINTWSVNYKPDIPARSIRKESCEKVFNSGSPQETLKWILYHLRCSTLPSLLAPPLRSSSHYAHYAHHSDDLHRPPQTTTNLLPNPRVLPQATTFAKPAPLRYRLLDSREMEPLRLAVRSIASDHLPIVDIPTEAVQLIVVASGSMMVCRVKSRW